MAEEIFVGSVAVGIVPSAKGFSERIREAVVPSASDIGREFGQRAVEGIDSRMGDFFSKWGARQKAQANSVGEESGTSYAESFRAKIEQILRDLPPAEVTANTAEAQEQVAKLRDELEDLHSKEIGVDLSNFEALGRIGQIKEQLDQLSDRPRDIMVGVNIDGAIASVDELRGIASKPVIVPVKLVSEGGGAGEASATKSIETDMAESGELAGQGFGARFSSKVQSLIGGGSASIGNLSSGISEKMQGAGEEAGKEFGGAFSGVLSVVSSAGIPLAIAGAAVAVAAVMGEKLDIAQKQLEVSLRNSGMSWDTYAGAVAATGKQMALYGYTQGQVDTSIRAVFQVTGSMTEAMKAQGTIANIAAAQHISLAAATTQYDRALTGNAKTLKQLGIIQATGATQDMAMGKAQDILADQIDTAGSMAKFAALHHLSLAAATKLVFEASGEATKAQDELAAHGLTGSTVAKTVQSAMLGNSAALKTLAKDGISATAANKLLNESNSGSVLAFNKLGIEVIPKSATAMQNFTQVQDILAGKMGGQAQAVAETFGGRLKTIKAYLIDAGEAIGMKVLPPLESFLGWIVKGIPTVEKIGGDILKIASPVISIFFDGLSTIVKALVKNFTVWAPIVGALAIAWVAFNAELIITNALLAINPFVALGIAIILIVGLIVKFHKDILHYIGDAMDFCKKIFDDTWGWIKDHMSIVMPIIGGLILGPIGIAAALIYTHLDLIKRTFDNTWGWIKEHMGIIMPIIANIILGPVGTIAALIYTHWNTIRNDTIVAWDAIKDFFVGIWHDIYDTFQAAVSWIINTFNDISRNVRTIWNAIWSWVYTFFHGQWEIIDSVLRAAVSWIINTFNDFVRNIRDIWTKVWNWVSDFVSSVLDGIDNIIKTALDWIHGTFTTILGEVHTVWSNFWDGVESTASTVWGKVENGLSLFFGGIHTAFKNAVADIKTIWADVGTIVKKPVAFIVDTVYNNGIVKVVDAIAGVVGMSPLKPVSGFASGTQGAPPGWAWVGEQGPELVRMTGGETVLTNQQSMATGLWGQGRGFAGGTGGGGAGLGIPAAAFKLTPTGDGGSSRLATPGGTQKLFDAGGGGGFSWESLNPVHYIEAGFDAAVKGLKDLTGDALGAAINHVINPMLDHIPGINTPFGGYIKKDITALEKKLVSFIENASNVVSAGGGGASGASIAADAEKYNGHKYIYGGPSNPKTGWDCSSFVSYILGHDFKMNIPGGGWAKATSNGTAHGPTASEYMRWGGAKDKASQNVNLIGPGNLLVWPTHVGFGAGKNRMFSAYSTAQGTIYAPATAGPTGEGNPLVRVVNGSAGDASGPAGDQTQNGNTIYSFLLNSVFGGHQIAAAGALASMWGESIWDPESIGDAGCGIMGWNINSAGNDLATYGGTCKAAGIGNGTPTQDLDSQLSAIIRFVQMSGDEGVITRMMSASSVFDAANLWGVGVERFGINDVHSAGVAAATAIMNGSASAGVSAAKAATSVAAAIRKIKLPGFASGTVGAPPGWAWVGEQGPELINMRGGEQVIPAGLSASIGGYAGGTLTSRQSDMLKVLMSFKDQGKSGLTLPGIQGDEKNALAIIAKYYQNASARSLEETVKVGYQNLRDAISRYGNLGSKIGTISGYANNVTSNLSGYASLSSLQLPSTAAPGQSAGQIIKGAMNSALVQLRLFASLITKAKAKHLNMSFIQQAIALGPDQGIEYLKDALDGGSKVISEINWQMGAISKEETLVGQVAANTVYGTKGTGKDFLSGLKAQQKDLDSVAQKMAEAFAKELSESVTGTKGLKATVSQKQAKAYDALEKLVDSILKSNKSEAVKKAEIKLDITIDKNNKSITAGMASIVDAQVALWFASHTAKKIAKHAAGIVGAASGWAWVGEEGAELINLSGGETILSHEQSMAALSRDPSRGYWMGTVGSSPNDDNMSPNDNSSGNSSGGIEKRLDTLIKATRGVGGDVASNLNSTGRIAGNKASWNNRR